MDMKNKPLISTEEDMPETKKSNGGCLSHILTVIGLIIFIYIGFYACTRDDTDTSQDVYEQTDVQSEGEDSELVSKDSKMDSESSQALAVENLLFHRLYTDLGTVEIHRFSERRDALEWMVENFTNRETYDEMVPVILENPLIGKSYYTIAAGPSNLYYIGETKDYRPHGFGAVFGLSTGAGTYDLQGEAFFQYVGNFKNGMMDGYGILFAPDEANITYACKDAIQIMADHGMSFSDDTGEKLARYLFDYVSYEGFFEENKKEGKGNEFGFYWDEDVIRFLEPLNPPIEGYLFGPVYPNVTMGEYKNGKLNGYAKIYKSNHLIYEGEMKNGKESGEGKQYYYNGDIEYEGQFQNGIPDGTGDYYETDQPTLDTFYEDSYLMPTDSCYITYGDLAPYSKEEVALIRNEIYARYGCTFNNENYRTYFESQSWYSPVEGRNAANFDTSILNDYEIKNIDTIVAYETQMGWR